MTEEQIRSFKPEGVCWVPSNDLRSPKCETCGERMEDVHAVVEPEWYCGMRGCR